MIPQKLTSYGRENLNFEPSGADFWHQICLLHLSPRPLKDRREIGFLLEEYGLKTGVEVGVKLGQFSREGWQFIRNL